MTLRDGNLWCDACPRSGPAVITLGKPGAEQWETVKIGDGEAHLCPRCIERRDAGVLGDDGNPICARCGRTGDDFASGRVWHVTQEPPEPGSYSRALCPDCFDPGRDARPI